jgi:hypothetical protein
MWDASVSFVGRGWLTKSSETTFSLSATNLLDTRTSDPGFDGLDLPLLGRTLMLSVRQAL